MAAVPLGGATTKLEKKPVKFSNLLCKIVILKRHNVRLILCVRSGCRIEHVRVSCLQTASIGRRLIGAFARVTTLGQVSHEHRTISSCMA